MDVDDEDDFYAPDDGSTGGEQMEKPTVSQPEVKPEQEDDGLEEGEEEDEDDDDTSDSDIDIITERKDGTKAAPPSTARYNDIRNIPQRTISSDVTVKPAAVKKETTAKGTATSGADLPAVATSKIDINAKPVYEPAGKPITQVNIDTDLGDNEKPWRRPGTDISDYFNYGFDEFTWALYAAKQDGLRSEYNQDKIAENNKKMFEDMNMMMMGGMPGMPGMPAGAGSAMPAMPGMEGIPPEMQAMMQQMMAQGIDPSQMDPSAMFAGMSGVQGNAGAGQGGNQNAGFGGQQGFGQGQGQNQQQMGYGYDQGMNNSGGNRGGGNFRGRGRGHRNW